MTSKQAQKIYRELMPEVDSKFWRSSHESCFRASTHETDEHIRMKFERWLYWRRQGASVFTELILTSGLRPDLVIVTENNIFVEEITQSESDKSIELKKQEYPWEVTRIKCQK